eukprot:7388620-Prymnesium_polylepis.1
MSRKSIHFEHRCYVRSGTIRWLFCASATTSCTVLGAGRCPRLTPVTGAAHCPARIAPNSP